MFLSVSSAEHFHGHHCCHWPSDLVICVRNHTEKSLVFAIIVFECIQNFIIHLNNFMHLFLLSVMVT